MQRFLSRILISLVSEHFVVILLYFLSTYNVKLLHKIPIINIAKQNHEKMAPKKCNQLKLVSQFDMFDIV